MGSPDNSLVVTTSQLSWLTMGQSQAGRDSVYRLIWQNTGKLSSREKFRGDKHFITVPPTPTSLTRRTGTTTSTKRLRTKMTVRMMVMITPFSASSVQREGEI